jgi:hypothetical protein
MRLVLLALGALALTGCESFKGVSLGLDLANADTTLSLRHGAGKTVVAAQQDGQRVSGYFRR